MSEILEKIRSRGHWRVRIRPDSFDAERVSGAEELETILHKTRVGFRGWDFPHLGKSQLIYAHNRVGQETDWEYYLESWQFCRSGQFIYQAGMKEDWHNRGRVPSLYNGLEPGEALDAREAIFRFTEIFEFASRLLYTPAGDAWMHLEIAVQGIAGRALWDQPGGFCFPGSHRATVAKSHYQRAFPFLQLSGDAKDLVLEAAQELFKHYGWKPSRSFLRDVQSDLLQRSAKVGR